ncbi:TraM-like conjugate transposon protein [Bacteroides eggerthii]|uniref:TraM-like conjugate transposon protein n=1 Tax=Bacteroides eggerthii TaxID=28111 RepID=A0A380YNS3_9BACE|nr:TraM-like conjugate transposon protein [Bacteroides eggerthii]
MTQSEKSRIIILGGAGIVTALLVWGIIASLPAGQDKGEDTEEVTLRGRIKESFTLEDMLKSVEKDNRGMMNPSTVYEGVPGRREPSGTDAENEEEIRRIRELIRQNEAEITGGSAAVTGGMQPSFPGKEIPPYLKRKKRRKKKSCIPIRWKARLRQNRAGVLIACGLSGRMKRMSSGHLYTRHKP